MGRIRDEVAVEGRWSREVQPVMREDRAYRMVCCDCGLVHDIEFWIEGGHVRMRVARNVRSTGQVRRHMRGVG